MATFHLQNMFETRHLAKNHSRCPPLNLVSACNLSEIFVGEAIAVGIGSMAGLQWIAWDRGWNGLQQLIAEEAEFSTSLAFGMVHGDVGMVQQCLHIATIFREHGNANTG